MKKFLRVVSVSAALVLVLSAALLSFSGCGVTENKTAVYTQNDDLTLNGEGRGIELFNTIVGSLPELSGAIPQLPQYALPAVGGSCFALSGFFPQSDASEALRSAVRLAATTESADGFGYVIIDSNISISDSIVVPSNVILCFANGSLDIAAGATVYYAANRIIAPAARLFFGNGIFTATESNTSLTVLGEWFGMNGTDNSDADDSPALARAINAASNVVIGKGTYYCKSTVTLPQKDISISGAGRKITEIVLCYSEGCKVLFNANNAVNGVFSISDVTVAELGHGMNGILLDYANASAAGDKSVNATSVYCYGFKNAFRLTNTVNASFKYIYSNANSCFLFLVSGNVNTMFSTSLGLSNKNLIIGNSGNGLTLNNCSSVWNYGIDVDLSDYSNVTISAGGFDLGYTALLGISKLHGENPAALRLTRCNEIIVRDMWIATNGGLSYMTNSTVGKPTDRYGIYMLDCTNVVVDGCTVTNHSYAISIVNSAVTTVNNIQVSNCQFIGNEDIELVLTKANGVTFSFNSHKQFGSGDIAACNEISGTDCMNISFIGDTFYKIANNSGILSSFTGSSAIVYDSNLFI